MRVLDELILEPGSFYVMDRGYVDFQRLYAFVLQRPPSLLTRAKNQPAIQPPGILPRRFSATGGAERSNRFWLRQPASIRHYPDKLRRIHYVDAETGRGLVFLTNNFALPALTIALLYKAPLESGVVLQMDQSSTCASSIYGTLGQCG